MSALHDLKERLNRTGGDGADALADVEHALQDARRKLADSAVDTAGTLRDGADDAVRDARRRARRVRRRARRQARTLRDRGGPRPVVVGAVLAGVSALVAAIAARRPLGTAAGRGATALTGVARHSVRTCRSRLRRDASSRGGDGADA